MSTTIISSYSGYLDIYLHHQLLCYKRKLHESSQHDLEIKITWVRPDLGWNWVETELDTS